MSQWVRLFIIAGGLSHTALCKYSSRLQPAVLPAGHALDAPQTSANGLPVPPAPPRPALPRSARPPGPFRGHLPRVLRLPLWPGVPPVPGAPPVRSALQTALIGQLQSAAASIKRRRQGGTEVVQAADG